MCFKIGGHVICFWLTMPPWHWHWPDTLDPRRQLPIEISGIDRETLRSVFALGSISSEVQHLPNDLQEAFAPALTQGLQHFQQQMPEGVGLQFHGTTQ